MFYDSGNCLIANSVSTLADSLDEAVDLAA